MLAQAGIPLTSGFIAKFDVFRAALQSEFYVSSVIVLIATVIGASFYLRLVLSMYSDSFDDNSHPEGASANSHPERARARQGGVEGSLSTPNTIAIGICVFVTVAIGILPSLLTGFTHVL